MGKILGRGWEQEEKRNRQKKRMEGLEDRRKKMRRGDSEKETGLLTNEDFLRNSRVS